MNGLFQTICKIGIFMICVQAVIHFRPQEAYEKYLKLLVSAMVLVQLFLPVGRFLFHGDSEELAVKSKAFLKGLEDEISTAERKAFETDSLLEQMTLEEVRRRVEEARTEQSAENTVNPESDGTDYEQPDTANDTVNNAADDSMDSMVNIEKIEVEGIQVQLHTDPPESVSAK